VGRGGAGTAVTVKRSADGVLQHAKHTLLPALDGDHTGPPRREKRALDSRHASIIENMRDDSKGGDMAVKEGSAFNAPP